MAHPNNIHVTEKRSLCQASKLGNSGGWSRTRPAGQSDGVMTPETTPRYLVVTMSRMVCSRICSQRPCQVKTRRYR